MSLYAVGEQSPVIVFLDFLYGGGSGEVYIATKASDGHFTQRFFGWPDNAGVIANYVLAQSDSVEVYISPSLYVDDSSAGKDNVKHAQVVWVEFDGNAPDPTGLPENIPAPTLRIQSSEPGHEHWYWRLDTFIGTEDLERINRALTYHLGADASGWDANQILRPPATINHKRSRPVGIIELNENTYTTGTFTGFEAPERISDALTLEVIPDAYDVVMAYAWPTQASALYRSKPEPGKRSSALMQLGYFAAEMGMSNAEIYSVLRNADDRWGKFKDRTDRDRRLLDLISKARLKYPIGGPVGEGASPIALEVYGFKSLLALEASIEWAIDGLLQKQGSMLLTGPSGAGKTQLSLRFAMSLALGRDYLGYSVKAPRRMLFLSLEMGLADIKYFQSQMAQGMTPEDLEVLEQNFLTVPVGEAIYLNQAAEQQRVEALIKEYQPDGVIFDSLGSTTSEELSSESVVKSITDWDAKIRKKFDVFSWFIHHQRKAQVQNKKPNSLADVYGSQYITARATSVYCLWPEDSGRLELSCLKKRLASKDAPVYLERSGHLDFTPVSVPIHTVKIPDFLLSSTSQDTISSESDGGFTPLAGM